MKKVNCLKKCMNHKIYTSSKLITILTSFYGQVADRTDEIKQSLKDHMISKYFYLTYLCMAATMLTLIWSFIVNPKKSVPFKFFLPNVIIFELIVVTVFWSFYFTAPELILGEIGCKPENYSLIVDLCQHLFPIFGLAVLFYETPMDHDYRRYIVNLFVSIIYTIMMHRNKVVKGSYPYGFLKKMSDIQIFVIFIPCMVAFFSAVLYGVIRLNIRTMKWKNIRELEKPRF